MFHGHGKNYQKKFKFLDNKNTLYLYDDNKIKIINKKIKKRLINYKQIIKKNFDYIIISPGIDINKCILNQYLKKNLRKIITDFDIFFSFYNKNKIITITGTNGKSTTAQILYEIIKKQKKDVRLVGNIGNPILLEKNITDKTIFVIEASSYQLYYSKLFKTNISVILNISPDHLERHKTLANYINSKFKLIKNQTKKDFAFLNTNNIYIKDQLKKKKFLPKIIKVNRKITPKILKDINNPYFKTDGNKENLSFVLQIAKILKIEKKYLFKVLKNFSGLKYRQQIIFKSKDLTIINDSKATSFSSSVSILKSLSNAYWIVGGLKKKGDKFILSKNDCKNFKAYIFGKNKSFFKNELKKLIKIENFKNIKKLIKKIFFDINKDKK